MGAESTATYGYAETHYRQVLDKRSTSEEVDVTVKQSIRVSVGAGTHLDVYRVWVYGPAGIMETEGYEVVPGGQAPPETPIKFQLEVTVDEGPDMVPAPLLDFCVALCGVFPGKCNRVEWGVIRAACKACTTTAPRSSTTRPSGSCCSASALSTRASATAASGARSARPWQR